MLYCSFEPGLFILQGLAPHESVKAFAVVRSLMLHKKMMDQVNVQIPMTQKYLERIYSALDKIPIINPPLESDLRQYIIASLAKMSSPLLSPAGIKETTLDPDFTSEWIDEETKRIWLDSLTSAMFEEFTNSEAKLLSATWLRKNAPTMTRASSPSLCAQIEVEEHYWDIPILADELGWGEIFCELTGWPDGLDSILIDNYAKKKLGVQPEQLSNRRTIRFESSCYRDILKEPDDDVRSSIVEVIACRAFNCIKPEQHDETISGQPGVRRVYVKKMTPPIRLHYVMNDDTITYVLYTNNDHNRGL